MRLTLVLHASPDSAHVTTLIRLAREAKAKGHEVTVFAMSAGVGALARADFTALAAEGIQLTVCEHNRAQVKAPEGVDKVLYGSQYELAGYVQDGDRVVTFS